MPSWKPNFNPDYFYFVTTGAVDSRHVFERDVIKRIIVDAFDSFRLRNRLKLYSFVIMPNHIHFIGQFAEAQPLGSFMRDLKRQTSDRIIRHLKAERRSAELGLLVIKSGGFDGQHHKVWEDDYQAKDVFSTEFLQQKMDYIHDNPCQPRWKLSGAPEDYAWSSARFYLTEDSCIIPIDDVRKALS